MLPVVVVGNALLYVVDVVVSQSHHALGVFAETLGGEITRQGGLQGDIEGQSAALGPGLLQFLAAVVQAHIFAVFDGVVDGVVPVVVALCGLLLKGGEVDRLHLQHGLHLMPYSEEGDAYHHQCRGAHGDAPAPTLLPTQEGIDGRDNDDRSENHIAREGLEDIDLVDEPKHQQSLNAFGPPQRLVSDKVIPNDSNAENDIEAETDVADEMRDLADVVVVVAPIRHATEQGGRENRQHID